MSTWEPSVGASDEWYTPTHIFNALGVTFDLDVAAPPSGVNTNVPCYGRLCDNSLSLPWFGFVWMNPPFGGRNEIIPWLDKFFAHGNGVALTPDRTSAPWWQTAANKAHLVLFVTPKVKFERPDGSVGDSPGSGTTLFAVGAQGCKALRNARRARLGWLCQEV